MVLKKRARDSNSLNVNFYSIQVFGQAVCGTIYWCYAVLVEESCSLTQSGVSQ